MQKYLTKPNIIQLALLIQFILLNVTNYFDFNSQVIATISFAGLLIGYFINVTKKGAK